MTKKQKEKIYAIHPGYVISKNDGNEHFITPRQLIGLYGVNPQQCIVLDYRKGPQSYMEYGPLVNYIHLYPRRDGNYSLPSGLKELREKR